MPDKNKDLEKFLEQSGAAFRYPATPDLATRTKTSPARRLIFKPLFAAAVLIALLLGAWSVPQVRASVSSWLRLGNAQISLDNGESPSIQATPLPSLRDLEGLMPLADAEAKAGFNLPASERLGLPDYVYYQQLGSDALVAFWTEDEIEISLVVLKRDGWIVKSSAEIVEDISINGTRAIWLEGDHRLYLQAGGDFQEYRFFVDSNVLIWYANGLTYRLEGNFSQNQAIEIMKSMQK